MPARSCRVLIYALVLNGAAAATLAAADVEKIWTGVYSADQAALGKTVFEANCATCHKGDLSGDRGPALKGDAFFSSWENGSVSGLFLKIKETMPKNRASSLTDDNYVSIVAYLLQANAFPPSTKGIALNTDDLEGIQIERQGGSKKGIPNFALVQVVGCLTQGQDQSWRLTRSTAPVVTKDQRPDQPELAAGAAAPLGTETFLLLSVNRFRPDDYKGHKMAAKGLLYKAPNDARLSLTSLDAVDSACVH
jgi:mono/diheme cytochrome c family protein